MKIALDAIEASLVCADGPLPFNNLEHAYPAWDFQVAGLLRSENGQPVRRPGKMQVVAIIPNFSPLMKPWCPCDCSRPEAEVAFGWDTMKPYQALRLGRALLAAVHRDIPCDSRGQPDWMFSRSCRLVQTARLWDLSSFEDCFGAGRCLIAAAQVAIAGEAAIDWKLWARLNDQQHRSAREEEVGRLQEKLGIKPLVHVAGAFQEMHQRCTRCNVMLADYRNASWPAGQEPPKGWAEGALVRVDGGCSSLRDSASADEMCGARA